VLEQGKDGIGDQMRGQSGEFIEKGGSTETSKKMAQNREALDSNLE
jgi:hypothetical protein